ncbi:MULTISPECIES: AzlC family ABC transporter permease [unclassified Roseateles]|uniref:AzlC family ABC transporter permease n=1 Tax=unclassified Roseateles TaxID=2626991 RepID=UPI0007012A38|nr:MULTISPECIES: AzlC family ABC transporter permease [unclassified Roseateles]KQW51295.1 branched-chain amino acid ABC transporter permease [Pelomonas sp. Root405]KRA77527.1 branched-chain amino acid ABC transporter permease [Pelomonas sp. Root662]
MSLIARLRALAADPDFRAGARDMASPSLGLAAWGLVTGMTMIKSGLTIPLAMGMSLLVFAGSAQLTALPLIASGAPLWVLLATAFCVNLRFVIFSAQWRHYFGHLPRWRRLMTTYFAADLNFVYFVKRYPDPVPAPSQQRYFWGGVAVNWPTWQLTALAGILLADRIPTHWGIGFAGVLALLGLSYSLLTERMLWWVAVTAAAVSIATYSLPLKLNILCAIVGAGAVGWWLDSRRARNA